MFDLLYQAEADVLYAIVKPTTKEGTDKLQLICDQVRFYHLLDLWKFV